MEKTLRITPFEEQVLTVLGDDSWIMSSGVSSGEIEVRGPAKYGYPLDWAGPAQVRKDSYFEPTYPQINFALGRLRRKGLVERIDNPDFQEDGYTAGDWKLTNAGKILLGIDPEPLPTTPAPIPSSAPSLTTTWGSWWSILKAKFAVMCS